MLFNSYIFIFLFLPLCLGGFYLFSCQGKSMPARLWLTGFSLWFYGYFNPSYLLIMVCSILFNYAVFRIMGQVGAHGVSFRRAALALGVAGNLAVLFYFKYYDFFVENVNALFGTSFVLKGILLPLGISFFTFQQIGFVTDAYRGEVKRCSFLDYALLRGAADSLYAFFRQNPDCMTVAVGTPKEEICSFLELRPAGHMEDADSFGQIRRLSCRCMERLRTENQVLQIHTRQGEYAVSMRSILYCQSDLKYVQITAKSGTVYRKLWKLDELLSILPEYFMRIHQSYVVNVREADAFDRTSHEPQMTDGSRLPVSRPYLQAVQALFGAKSAVSGADSEM